MAFLTELWLAILVATVVVFIASSVIHMALPYHRNDAGKLPGEEGVMDAVRDAGVKPGVYTFPRPDNMKEWCSPEMKQRLERGPAGWLTVLTPAGFSMGRSLPLWFLQSLIISLLAAYIAWHALTPGARYLDVFQIVGPACILGYCVGHMHDSIWKGQPWIVTGKFIFDGVIYSLLTAGVFGWLWPAAEAGLPANMPG